MGIGRMEGIMSELRITRLPASSGSAAGETVGSFGTMSSFWIKGVFERCQEAIEFTTDTLDAAMKSSAILARGQRAFNNACFGALCMSVEEGALAAKAVLGCRTIVECFALQRDLAKLNVSRMAGRLCMLSTMAIQVGEDTAVPLFHRANFALEQFAHRQTA